MKIALCGRFNTDKKHQGGSAEVFLTLGELLSKHNEVTLFGRGKPTQDIINMCNKNSIKFYYIPSDNVINILLGPFRALRLLRKNWNNFDLIHTHTGSFAWASTFFRKKCKIITNIHQYLFPYESNFKIRIYFAFERLLLKYASKKSDLTITIAEYIKQIIKERWKLSNVKVIPNGINLKEFKYTIKKEEEFQFRMLYVGRLSNQKGVSKLIESIFLLKNKNIILDIVGDGEEEFRLKKLVLSKNIKNVIFHGRKSGKELLSFYNSANVFLLASDFEGQSLVLLEAMAIGIPIVASDVPGTHELIQNVGILVNPPTPEAFAEAIEKLIRNPKLRERLAKNGLKEVKKYSWDNVDNQIEKNYREILKR
jgi:glycosyltransferase involved in cell wall biosynthesis